jgi:hypothetical protein
VGGAAAGRAQIGADEADVQALIDEIAAEIQVEVEQVGQGSVGLTRCVPA